MHWLIEDFTTPFETAPFDKIKTSDYMPALKESIDLAKERIDSIVNSSEKATFENVIEALERCDDKVNLVASIFFNLNSAETHDELQAIAKEFSPVLSEFSNDILLNEKLFLKVKDVFERKNEFSLSEEQNTLLAKTFRQFKRNGASLEGKQKEELRDLDKTLSKVCLEFGENILKDTNNYELILTDETDLDGLPQSMKTAASELAKEKGHSGKWAITLDYPSVVPYLTYADNREKRKEIHMAFSKRGYLGGETDNSENIKEIAKLRHKRANLLGYKTHAHFVLEERMAETPDKVQGFLDELLEYGKPIADKEIKELSKYAQSIGGPEEVHRWDYMYYAEKLKMEKFEIDDELLRPYFKLENCVDGVFEVAKRLYGLKYKKRDDIPKYHEDVWTYEVEDESGNHIGVFYADFFPRKGKRAGAWMTSYRDQKFENGKDVRPHISIVCNFSKPTKETPSLLNFREVQTLFHEFGHSLHGILAKGNYQTLSGTSVFWDFVELPSQILENWCYEKECLDLFAKHHETGEKIPTEYIQKIKDAASFHEGRNTLRQLGLGYLDMSWHCGDPGAITDVEDFEKVIDQKTSLHPYVDGTATSPSFSHIFQGGYSAGYYSYKWAEVLDADAFEYFKEKGIFNREVADKFRTNILERGGAAHPMELYKRFRGQEPSIKPLLKRAGLI